MGTGTRPGLIRAAAEVFADRGFRAATIREICRRAGANVASVKYHFGDKGRLYAAVLEELAAEQVAVARLEARLLRGEERLREFVGVFLRRVLADGPMALHGKIMAREMVEPTAALDHVVAGFIRPEAEALGVAVREIVGDGVPEDELRLLCMSVVGQVVFYKHCRPVVERLFPDFRCDARLVQRLTDHITGFSVAALRRIREERRRSGSAKASRRATPAVRPAPRRRVR